MGMAVSQENYGHKFDFHVNFSYEILLFDLFFL